MPIDGITTCDWCGSADSVDYLGINLKLCSKCWEPYTKKIDEQVKAEIEAKKRNAIKR
jgi:hypothetical protein